MTALPPYLKLLFVWIGFVVLHTSCSQTPTDPCSGISCDAGKSCVSGSCLPLCTSTQTRCASACVELQSDKTNCGRCGEVCREGETCQKGTCLLVCSSGKTLCDGGCVDTQTHRQHCGMCQKSCAPGESCVAGQCQLSCPSGTTACSGQCIDTNNHPSHCGACGKVCQNHEYCRAGACVARSCPPTQKECAGLCIDIQNHREHCGDCQISCQDGQLCQAGKCILQCPSTQTICDGICVDLSSNPRHCGACNQVCVQGQVCSLGQCKQICQTGLNLCAGACVDWQTSQIHCGRCNNSCSATEACTKGTCTCAPGLTDCTGKCVDLQTDNFHCGTCGKTCPLGQRCIQGQCVAACKPGETNCADLCSDLRTDRNHCGSCGNTCLPGHECCNATCINPKTDSKHCGQCNNICATGHECNNGVCTCAASNKICSGACVDIQTHQQHCGSCGNACNTTETCVSGKCVAVWAVSVGGITRASIEEGSSILRDGTGNLYVLGRFPSNLSMGTHQLSARDGGIFVAKLNAQFQVLWAVSPQLTTSQRGAIAIDTSGNVYLTGSFTGDQAVFGSTTLQNPNAGLSYQTQIFVSKLDPQGQWLWAVSGGGANADQAQSIGIDGNGNLYITGTFSTGFATPISTFGSLTLSSRANSDDILVAKLDTQGQWLWVRSAGGNSADQGTSIATDTSGNSYLVGTFEGTATFGTNTLTSQGSSDIFVGKIDKDGTWIWVLSGGGSNTDIGTHITHDTAGNTYIVGRILGTATFGSTTLSTQGSFDLFVAKIAANGSWSWAQAGGGSGSDYAQAVGLDGSGNLYMTGYMTSNVGTFGNSSYVSLGGAEIFVAKLDNTGKWLWVKMAGGNGDDYGQSLVVDSTGNAYVTGSFSSSAGFGTSTVLSQGELDIFVTKIDSNGNYSPPVTWGGTTSNQDTGYAIASDTAGNLYVAGAYHGSATFGSHAVSSHSNSLDLFVGKLSSTGQWLWVQSAGGPLDDRALAIAVDSNANVYITGQFFATTQSQGGATFGQTTLSTKGLGDIFVAKLNTSGQWQWAKQAGGTRTDAGYGITTDANGNLYVIGTFQTNSSTEVATFDTKTLTGRGNHDIFVGKLDKDGTWLWLSQAGGSSADEGFSIAYSGGVVYITGGFEGTANFGSLTQTARSSQDIFVAQMSATTGNWQWLKTAGSTGPDSGRGVATDSSGNVYITGYTFNTSTSPATFGTTIFSSDTNTDIFVAKLDNNGNWLWAKQAGGDQSDVAHGIFINAQGNLWITGSFGRQATFGTLSFSSATLTSSIYIAKLDQNGTWNAVQTASLPFEASEHVGYGVVADNTGYATIAGSFLAQTLFGPIALTSQGKQDIFVWKTVP